VIGISKRSNIMYVTTGIYTYMSVLRYERLLGFI